MMATGKMQIVRQHASKGLEHYGVELQYSARCCETRRSRRIGFAARHGVRVWHFGRSVRALGRLSWRHFASTRVKATLKASLGDAQAKPCLMLGTNGCGHWLSELDTNFLVNLNVALDSHLDADGQRVGYRLIQNPGGGTTGHAQKKVTAIKSQQN
jgi:hypothetical protein